MIKITKKGGHSFVTKLSLLHRTAAYENGMRQLLDLRILFFIILTGTQSGYLQVGISFQPSAGCVSKVMQGPGRGNFLSL